jgi:hypothetical protein
MRFELPAHYSGINDIYKSQRRVAWFPAILERLREYHYRLNEAIVRAVPLLFAEMAEKDRALYRCGVLISARKRRLAVLYEEC